MQNEHEARQQQQQHIVASHKYNGDLWDGRLLQQQKLPPLATSSWLMLNKNRIDMTQHQY